LVKRKRISLSLRLQPYSGTLMAEVASWLNSVERDEAKRLVEAALIMAYLPYARAERGADSIEIERCCWETQDLLDKHGFNLRQALQVPQPQWRGHETQTQALVAAQSSELPVSADSTAEDEMELDSPSSQIEGQGSYSDVDALFGDD
jgi:hypothetical protein